MGLEFRSPDDNGEKTRRPPNYLSRSVQMRLMMLIGSLMLVGVLMYEARKPENWRWMFPNQGTHNVDANSIPPNPVDPGDSDDIDTRLRRSEIEEGNPSGVINYGSVDHSPTAIVLNDQSPIYRTQFNAWSQFWENLDAEQRELLQRVLLFSRWNKPLELENQSAWQDVVFKLHEDWVKYIDHARGSMETDTSLQAEERKLWENVLADLESEWNDRARPGLQSFFDGSKLTDEQHEALNQLQLVLDEITLNRVRDNTIWRASESYAWFRLLDRLRTADNEDLRAQSEVTGFLPLYRQSKQYRGKLVTVRGQARMVYRVDAEENIYGLNHYYIIWLKPANGPNKPLVVYSLSLPDGFPLVANKEDSGAMTELKENVEITGYFFKKWAYRAKDGINTAPLLVAKEPVWSNQDPFQSFEAPKLSLLVVSVVGCAVLAICIAVFVYRFSGGMPSQSNVSDAAVKLSNSYDVTTVED
ncbi:MAG: hypothetical protein ACI9G1_005136, partial [Pirellulaceae bacterium]